MKKILLLFVAFISFINAQAQYRFYAGIEGGLKWTFTGSMAYNFDQTNETKSGYAAGLVIGYRFRKIPVILETGFSRTTLDFRYNMDFGNYPTYPNPAAPYTPTGYVAPELYTSTKAVLIPLRVKSRLLQFGESKTSIWLTGGAAYMALDYKPGTLHTNLLVNDTLTYRGVAIFRKDENGNEYPPMVLNDVVMGGTGNTNLMIEAGLEIQHQVNDRVVLSFSGRHQSGLQFIQAGQIEDLNRSPRSGTFPIRVTTSSKGDGFYLILALIYAFGKRKERPN